MLGLARNARLIAELTLAQALKGTALAPAPVPTIRLKRFKLAACLKVTFLRMRARLS